MVPSGCNRCTGSLGAVSDRNPLPSFTDTAHGEEGKCELVPNYPSFRFLQDMQTPVMGCVTVSCGNVTV